MLDHFSQLVSNAEKQAANSGVRSLDDARNFFDRELFDVAKVDYLSLCAVQLCDVSPQKMVTVHVQVAFAQLNLILHEVRKRARGGAVNVFEGRRFVASMAVEGKIACHHDEPAAQMSVILEILIGFEKLDKRFLHDVFGKRGRVENGTCYTVNGVLVLSHGSFYKLTALQRTGLSRYAGLFGGPFRDLMASLSITDERRRIFQETKTFSKKQISHL